MARVTCVGLGGGKGNNLDHVHTRSSAGDSVFSERLDDTLLAVFTFKACYGSRPGACHANLRVEEPWISFTPRPLLRRRGCPFRLSRVARAVAPEGDVHRVADGGVSSRPDTTRRSSKKSCSPVRTSREAREAHHQHHATLYVSRSASGPGSGPVCISRNKILRVSCTSGNDGRFERRCLPWHRLSRVNEYSLQARYLGTPCWQE